MIFSLCVDLCVPLCRIMNIPVHRSMCTLYDCDWPMVPTTASEIIVIQQPNLHKTLNFPHHLLKKYTCSQNKWISWLITNQQKSATKSHFRWRLKLGLLQFKYDALLLELNLAFACKSETLSSLCSYALFVLTKSSKSKNKWCMNRRQFKDLTSPCQASSERKASDFSSEVPGSIWTESKILLLFFCCFT